MYRLNTKISLTMLCLSGFELYSRWVPLLKQTYYYFVCFTRYFKNGPRE